MATCKDCIHYDLCKFTAYKEARRLGEDKRKLVIIDNNVACKFFKDNARMIEFPCNPGDTVYCIFRNQKSLEWYVKEMTVYSLSLHYTGFRVYVTPIMSFVKSEIGVRLFLTCEEAEKALAEKRSKNEKP